MRYWRTILVIVALASLLMIVATHRPDRSPAASRPTAPPASIGKPFPHLSLAALPGIPPLTDADLRAGQVTLVNLFASWCLPCRIEAAQLAALHEEGIIIVGIAVRDEPANTTAFLAATGMHFERVGLDLHELVQPALFSSGIPETWLVDGHGIVRARFRGDLHAADLPQVRAAIAAVR